MFLTGSKIIEAVHLQHIVINPFIEDRVGANSYDLTLSNKLFSYDMKNGFLDSKSVNDGELFSIFDSGFLLKPNILYLGSTCESAFSNKYIPIIEGRSSFARLGLSVHLTAGVGDIGWGFEEGEKTFPTWTLELSVIHPLIIYPGQRICQVMFAYPYGDISRLYKGKYNNQVVAEPSMSYMDMD